MNLAWLPEVVALTKKKEERIEEEEEKLAAEQERDPVLTSSKKIFAEDMEKVVKLATIMATLQKVEGVYAVEKGEAQEGSEILAAFGLLMILGVVLYKLVERLCKVFHERREKDEKRDQEEWYQTRAPAREQDEYQPRVITRDHGEYHLALFSAIRELGKLAPFRAIEDVTNLMCPKQKKNSPQWKWRL